MTHEDSMSSLPSMKYMPKRIKISKYINTNNVIFQGDKKKPFSLIPSYYNQPTKYTYMYKKKWCLLLQRGWERQRETERGGSEFQSLKSTDMLRQ